MNKYSDNTIKDVLKGIEKGRTVLPAMQRSFVWPEEKIYNLFDSLMRGYPIGTFLFWKIDKSTFKQYTFNLFIKNCLIKKDHLQKGDKATASFSDYEAVLDGQQRLTSLYIGACGKQQIENKGKKVKNSNLLIDKYLCIDILFVPNLEEKFLFRFRESEKIEKILVEDDAKKHFWIKVNTVYNFSDPGSILTYVQELDKKVKDDDLHEHNVDAIKLLMDLNRALTQENIINVYSAQDMDLSQVVEIFVRVNSGGEKLSASDLMLSVASGVLEGNDVHSMLEKAVKDINEAVDPNTGFVMKKEIILTAGLMFTGAESLYLSNHANYTTDRMNLIFKKNWTRIIEALKNTVIYIEFIGFIGRKLSNSIILPIAYYFYKNDISDSHKTSDKPRACCDRVFIRQWLLRSMLKDVFMEGTAASLLQFRNLILNTKKKYFPLDELMEKEIKKPLTVGEDQIEEILNLKYGDSKIIPLLVELGKNRSDSDTQVDHIWPKSTLTNGKKLSERAQISDNKLQVYKNNCNSILNLQLLQSTRNQEKSDLDYDKWLEKAFTDKNELSLYFETNLIPKNSSYKLEDLEEFWKKRNELFRKKIKEAFPDKFIDLITRYNLQEKIK